MKFNSHHVTHHVLGKGMVHEVMNLPNPLFDTKIQQHQATQVFGAEGNTVWEVFVDAQLIEDSWNWSALDLIWLAAADLGW